MGKGKRTTRYETFRFGAKDDLGDRLKVVE
jgi:hypothetical protein